MNAIEHFARRRFAAAAVLALSLFACADRRAAESSEPAATAVIGESPARAAIEGTEHQPEGPLEVPVDIHGIKVLRLARGNIVIFGKTRFGYMDARYEDASYLRRALDTSLPLELTEAQIAGIRELVAHTSVASSVPPQ